jgi:hypothetical protein
MSGPAGESGPALSFRTPSGTWEDWPAEFGPDQSWAAPFRTRAVTAAAGMLLVQHRLPVETVTIAGAREALEREAGAAVAIARAVGDGPHAAAFLPFVGYQLDVDEPFLLYEVPRGRPVADFAGQLPVEEWQRMLRALMVAARVLARAGLAHRDITPASVRWDGTRASLGRPRHAELVGRSRWSAGMSPYASPEQRAGSGPVDVRDDVWSIAHVAYYVLTGQAAPGSGRPADLERIPALARPLGNAFSAVAADRPTPEEALRLLSCPDPLPSAEPGPDPLDPGREAFEEVRRSKWNGTAALPGAPPGQPRGPEGGPPDGARRRWLPGRGRRGGANWSGG